ncbi:putative manganese-dependent inorganic diphosphatase [Selenomonas bovis]|jgi:manganese-dependent inorganic pyrophosphatase|uniref:inorganic diphosphatase n=1 Tax=Selenomonas bovis TaxID=416586 RepID=A0A848B281_9FIRM|nr:putative manganese-dependent inorganic diphosphatase [Selenomonas bovis]MCI6171727.1 putative manganese-dependent inorganic diphosphatase [Selenomonas bovis]MCI6752875.1 putative manganese-dependent inorganic diphosphatase [Selenomonas bovis]MCI7056397.1 putative manganese-dependent inorganic diphosphatase [Selenomonas bovis]NMD98349.1 putative manganese-dependent inorganic diphosphatase [Selenomonas bovis]
MKNTKPIYIIGHRNPDTDSICSAIGYAHLKQALGENVVAARAGKVNAETKYALEYFHMQQPLLLSDLYPRVKDVLLDCKIVVKQHDTLRQLGEIMRDHDLRSVPVTDSKGILVGIVTVSDLAKRYFQELGMANLSDMRVRYRDIIAAIDAKVLVDGIESDFIQGDVRIAAGSLKTIKAGIKENDIVLIGDRHDETIIDCVEQGISVLIITGNGRVSADVIEAAEARHMFVLSTPYDTYTTARLINQCVPVRRIMHENPVCFKPMDLLSDIKGTMEETHYRNYPVIENGRLVGLVSRDELTMPERDRVILVDHNERGQAVEGIEEAKIVEVIDHHRLGGIQTSEPIFTHAEPVGCTATIVANMHWQQDVDIPAPVAGLLLSAILSDTVLFKSPTCTPYDKKTAERLAEIAGVDLKEYGMAMLKAGSGIGDMTPMEIAKNDSKEFQMGDYHLLISQISVMDTKEVLGLEPQLIEAMTTICEKEGFDMSLVMVTDILEEATYLLYAGSPKTLIGEAFKKDASGTHVYLPGVMSRKKQIVPPLSEAVKRIKEKE